MSARALVASVGDPGSSARRGAPIGVSSGRVFWVLERSLPELERRVASVARRAQRLGSGMLALRDTGERRGERARVVLEGEPPTLAGWTLVAVVDHRDDEPTLHIVSSPALALDPRRFREARCDHCGLRRRRAETFVVWHAATRRVRQVGSGCLAEFLGGHDPRRLCRQAECVLLAERALRRAAAGSREPAVGEIGVEEFAAHAAHVLRLDGWVSRERARESGRSASADAALRSLQSAPGAPDAADRALARDAMRWARELLAAEAGLSVFERDALAVARAGAVVGERERGLACALIAVYRARRVDSRHLGRLKAWLDVVVLVERVSERPSARYGIVRRHDLLDVGCNRLVWWQTVGSPLPLGCAVGLRGRVERHTHFGANAVTVLARCRPLDRDPS